MLAADLPTKFNIPFANAAGPSYIRNVPQASQIGIQAGAASLTDGFPPVTFLPVGAGGTPPFGQDFNGLLKQITQWNRWQAAGGTVKYDGTFSTAIGGYPAGAVLASTTAGNFWLNTVDNNTNDPDSVSTGWLPMGASAIQQQTGNYATSSNVGTAYAITLNPAPTSYAQLVGVPIRVKWNASLGASGATINVNALGAKNLNRTTASALAIGDIQANAITTICYDGIQFQILECFFEGITGYRNLGAVNVPNNGTPTTILSGVQGLVRVYCDNGASITYSATVGFYQFATSISPSNISAQGVASVSFSMSGTNLQMAITSTGTWNVTVILLNN